MNVFKLEDTDETWLILGFFLYLNKKQNISYDDFPETIKNYIEANNIRQKFE